MSNHSVVNFNLKEIEDWKYRINREKKEVILEEYIGSKENVNVFSKYNINGVFHKTKISCFRDCHCGNYMFRNNHNIESVTFKSGVDFLETYFMDGMFENCTSLKYVFFENIDTRNVKSTKCLFKNCINLESFCNPYISKIDSLSTLDFSNVVDATEMFCFCKSLKELNMPILFGDNLVYAQYMCYNCYSLERVNITNLKTKILKYACGMFYGCMRLVDIDISSFNTKNIISIDKIFFNCLSLEYIYISKDKFKLSEVKHEDFVTNCKNLKKIVYNNKMVS